MLNLSDSKIDELLLSDNVDSLRKYRNGTFHFQKDYFDSRFLKIVKYSESSVPWIHELYKEFGRYFLEWYKEKGIDPRRYQ